MLFRSVSYAWGLAPGSNGGLNTFGLRSSEVTHEISLSELKAGDILINTEGANFNHVLIFGNWVDRGNLVFSAYEMVEGYYGKAIHRDLKLVVINNAIFIPGEGQNQEVGDAGTGPYEPRRLNAFP